MPRVAEATNLVSAGPDTFGRDVLLTPTAAEAWREMQQAAAREDLELLLISGFRSVAYQAGIVRRKLATGQSLDEILRVSAHPGHSEHHAGTAIDLGSPHAEHLSEAFATTPEFEWLRRHAPAFGFRLSYPPHNAAGIAHEPWHWNLDQ